MVVSVATAGRSSQLTTWCYPTAGTDLWDSKRRTARGAWSEKEMHDLSASSQLSVELRRRPGTGHAACNLQRAPRYALAQTAMH